MAIRIACIGLGWVSLHRHVPSIKRHPEFQLVGAIDSHPGHAAAIARQYNLKRFAETDDLAKVPWLDEVDAIAISTSPMYHAPIAITALSMGKHVLTEKPFAMTVEEGAAMCEASKKYDRILAVMHNFQFSRAARKLAKDVANGKLGKVKRIAAHQLGNPRRRLPSWFEQLPLGLFYDESPHFFYLLHGLAGGALSLKHAHGIKSASNLNTPSAISLVYRNSENIPVTIDCQFDSAISEWYVFVTGEKSFGILDVFRDIYIRLPNDGSHSLPQILRTSASTITQHIWQHIPNGLAFLLNRLDYGNDRVFDMFASAIKSGEPPEMISGDNALTILKLQHEATKALEKSMY